MSEAAARITVLKFRRSESLLAKGKPAAFEVELVAAGVTIPPVDLAAFPILDRSTMTVPDHPRAPPSARLASPFYWISLHIAQALASALKWRCCNAQAEVSVSASGADSSEPAPNR